MIMNDPRKKMATLIVAKLKKGGESMKEQPEKDGAEQELNSHEIAADEILSAIESKDAKALTEALKSFVEMCDESEDESETEDMGTEASPEIE
jgi:hypothetical protein